MVWSPLGWGKLTGKIRRDQPAQPGSRAHDIAGTGPHYEEERLFRIVDALDAVAAETGKTIPQVALNWLLRRPTVATVIVGARNEEQLVQNIGAVGWQLTTGPGGGAGRGQRRPAGLSGLASARLPHAEREGRAMTRPGKVDKGGARTPGGAGRRRPRGRPRC